MVQGLIFLAKYSSKSALLYGGTTTQSVAYHMVSVIMATDWLLTTLLGAQHIRLSIFDKKIKDWSDSMGP